MEKRHELPTECLNCGAAVKGAYCYNCGQRVRDNTDRSLSRLFGDFLTNVFFLDNRFLLSVWYLIRFPSRMTVEFLEGKRRKFISPVTLFLFINLVYFLVSPLSDYSLPLEDQLYSQPYSKWMQGWVEQKMQNEALSWQEYSVTYQNASDNISKSVMIINVPMIAIFVYLMAFKQRRFYFDSLIFSFHFFSLFMISWIMLDWAGKLIDYVAEQSTTLSTISFNFFVLIVPFLYALLGTKNFLKIKWYWSIPAGFGVLLGALLANLIYRFIILILTVWTT